MFLTLRTHGARATVSNSGRIEHTHRPIVLGTPFLWIERSSLPTTQRAIGLREKILSPKASYSRHTCPVRRTEGRSSWGGGWRWQSFSSRGGKTR